MSRGIDHVVHGVADLDAAARRFEALGFAVGARNRHPWGTENRLVVLGDGFIELIAVPDPDAISTGLHGTFAFGARVAAALAAGEGVCMVALRSEDAAADAASFRGLGLGSLSPLHFERRAERPDASSARVAFSLAAVDGPDEGPVLLFTCQHHGRADTLAAASGEHPNGATALTQVLVATARPARVSAYLAPILGAPARPLGGDEHELGPEGARFDVLTPEDAGAILGAPPAMREDPSFAAYRVEVPDLAPVAARLAAAGLPSARRGHSLVVPAAACHGTALAFHAP